MKRLNLDETWKLCLQMWRWIAKQRREDSCADIGFLKIEWLRKHGIKEDEIMSDCFFCDYGEKHLHKRQVDSCNCPAQRIDHGFHCQNPDYNFYHEPIAFYNKLRALNKKRLAKK